MTPTCKKSCRSFVTQDPNSVEVELHRSLLLLSWILSVHSLVICLLFFLTIPAWLKFLTIILVAAGGANAYRLWYTQPINRLARISGHWQLRHDDQKIDVVLQRFFRLSRLLLLQFRGSNKRYYVLVLPDSTSPANLRRIHVTLQLG